MKKYNVSSTNTDRATRYYCFVEWWTSASRCYAREKPAQLRWLSKSCICTNGPWHLLRFSETVWEAVSWSKSWAKWLFLWPDIGFVWWCRNWDWKSRSAWPTRWRPSVNTAIVLLIICWINSSIPWVWIRFGLRRDLPENRGGLDILGGCYGSVLSQNRRLGDRQSDDHRAHQSGHAQSLQPQTAAEKSGVSQW